MAFRMRTFKFVFLLISVGHSLTSGDQDSSEKENTTNIMPESVPMSRQKTYSELNSTKKNSNNRPRDHFVTPDEKLIIIEPRFRNPQFADEGGLAITHLGFPTVDSQRRNIYLSDNTGKYNVKLGNFHEGRPSNFQTALGAISAHILNQRNNPEYIAYPPNGDPYNYPSYRGHPRGIEPPAVRAYERASNPNYDDRLEDFDRENPGRHSVPDDYDHQTGFSNRYQNLRDGFYNNGGAAFFPRRLIK